MDEPIAQTCHRAPLHRGITLPQLGGNLLGCLSDDLQAAHEDTAKRLVGLGENVPKILTRREGHPQLRPGCEGRERVTATPGCPPPTSRQPRWARPACPPRRRLVQREERTR